MLKWILALIAIAGAAWWYFSGDALPSKQAIDESLLYTVIKQDISVGTVESGQLQAVKSHKVRSSVRGKIEWIIKEGEEVKEGDKVLTLEKKGYEDEIKNATEDLKKKQEDLAFYSEGTETEEHITQSWIEDAQIKYDEAKENLRKFKQIDSRKKSNDLDKKIESAEEGLTQAREELDKKQTKLDESVFVESDVREKLEKEYQAAQKKVTNAVKQLETAVNEKNIYKSRTYPKDLLRISRDLERARLEVDKERGRAKQSMVNHHNKIDNIKKQIKQLEKRLTRATDALGKCEITAPVSGVVIYGDPKSGRNNWVRRELKAGGNAYQNYTLMTIPDMSKFSVQVPISEHARGRIAIGCPAQIEIPAIPGLVLKGSLSSISQLAKPRQSDNPSSPKVYTGTVDLLDHDTRMVSGMTARVSLIGEVKEAVISLPIEAVFSDDDGFYCYKKLSDEFERQNIKLGIMNAFIVEVADGLQLDDIVCLIDPAEDVSAIMQ